MRTTELQTLLNFCVSKKSSVQLVTVDFLKYPVGLVLGTLPGFSPVFGSPWFFWFHSIVQECCAVEVVCLTHGKLC